MTKTCLADSNFDRYAMLRKLIALKLRIDMCKFKKSKRHTKTVCVPLDATFTVINRNRQR